MKGKKEKKVKTMSINFEEDKQQSINKTDDAHLLSAQVTKLQGLEDELASKETELKKLKKV